MCREEVLELRTHVQPKLDGLGIGFVTVVKETAGREEFVEKYWPAPLPLHFDLDNKLFPVVNGTVDKNGRRSNRSMGLLSGIGSFVFGGAVKKNVKRCNKRGVKGNQRGEGLRLGGLAVVGPAGAGARVVYLFQERAWGDHAPLKEVLGAVDAVAAAQPAAPAQATAPSQQAPPGAAAAGSAL